MESPCSTRLHCPLGPHPTHPTAVIAQASGGLRVELQLTLQLGHVL